MASSSSSARHSIASIHEDVVITPALSVAPEVIVSQPMKVQPPELFKGMKGRADVFIVQLRLCFGFQAAQFVTETSKILYAASYL